MVKPLENVSLIPLFFFLQEWDYRLDSKLTNTSGACKKSGCLSKESINVGQALVPHMDGYIDNIGHKAKGGQRRVQEQSV